MRAEWALVDEILTSENRNPLRDLQRGSLSSPPCPLFLSLSFSLLPSNDGAVESREGGKQQREEKRETKGKGRGWVGRVFSMNLKGVGRE